MPLCRRFYCIANSVPVSPNISNNNQVAIGCTYAANCERAIAGLYLLVNVECLIDYVEFKGGASKPLIWTLIRRKSYGRNGSRISPATDGGLKNIFVSSGKRNC